MNGATELFGETYYGAENEDDVMRIISNLGYGAFDFSILDYPTKYPCLFSVKMHDNPNGRDWGTMYVYYEEDLRRFYDELGTILNG